MVFASTRLQRLLVLLITSASLFLAQCRLNDATHENHHGMRLQFLPTHRDALVTWYINSNGPRWYRNTGWLSSLSVCSWQGVQCDASGVNVITIDMANNNIDGTFPSTLQYITTLQRLSVPENNITGALTAVSQLLSLQHLDVHGNRLDAPLPATVLWPSLQYFDASRNLINGGIPGWIGDVNNLVHANLSKNMLTGPLPFAFTSLLYLREFDVSGNRLTGLLPDSLGNLFWLWVFDVSDNRLSGTMPSSVGSMRNLRVLDLSRNSFSGSLPASFGGAINLQAVALSHNQLSGTIPLSIKDLNSLQSLRFRANFMSGAVPDQLWLLPELATVDLSFNDFTGTLPTSIGNVGQLESIELSGNRFSGSLPSTLGYLPRLKMLYLESTCFNGTPPEVVYRCDAAAIISDPRFSTQADCVISNAAGCFAPALFPFRLSTVAKAGIAGGVVGLVCLIALVLIGLRHRIQERCCPRAHVITSDLETQDAIEYEKTIRELQVARAKKMGETRVSNPDVATPAQSPLSTQRSVTPASRGRILQKKASSKAVVVPSLNLDALTFTVGQSPHDVMTSPVIIARPERLPETVTIASSSRPSSAPRKRLTRPASAPAIRRNADTPSSKSVSKRAIAIPIGPTPPPTASTRRSRNTTVTQSQVEQPEFVESQYLPDMRQHTALADVASAYLSADVFRDVATATTTTQLIDSFTRLFVMKSRNIAIPRKTFKAVCSQHRDHFPALWTGQALQAYYDCLKRL